MPWSPPDVFSLLAAFCFGVVLPWAQRTVANQPRVLRYLARAGLPFLLLAAGWERGSLAALWSLPALGYAIWLFAGGVGRFFAAGEDQAATRWLEALAATGPIVAAAAWIWSRYDGSFAGFPDPLATLTTVHFSITFGALPLAMAAWTRRVTTPSVWREVAVAIYVVLAPATALCFAFRTRVMVPGFVEALCAVLFAAGLVVWWVTLGNGRGRWLSSPLLVGFTLGAGYTLTQHFGWPWLSIPEMMAVHGSFNLVGTVLLICFAPVRECHLAPPAPDPGVTLDAGSAATALFVDHHRRELGPWSPEGFAKIRAALLGYHFYPETTMIRRTQFEDEGRAVRVGDRIGMGLFLPNLPGLPPFSLPAVVEIHEVADEEDLVRLGYQTTRRHYGRGEWVAEVSRQGDQLVLEVRCHVRPSRWFAWIGLPFYRSFQLRAFRSGYGNLARLV